MPRQKQLSFPVSEEEHRRLKGAANARGMTIKASLLQAAELLFSQLPESGLDRYRVTLPLDLGDGTVHHQGETVDLPLEIAKCYAHALIRVDVPRAVPAQTGLQSDGVVELPVFRCPAEDVPYHERLQTILNDPEERGGIVANLKWGSEAVRTKRKVKKA